MPSKLIDLPLVFVCNAPSGLAICVRRDEDSPKVWLPLRTVEISMDDPTEGVVTVTLAESLAVEKGLI